MFRDWYARQPEHKIIHQESNHTVYGQDADNYSTSIAHLSQYAVDLLNSLQLEQYQISKPHFYSYVLSGEEFPTATDIPEKFAKWATVCVRASKDNNGFEDMVIWSKNHSPKVPDLENNYPSEADADVIRESIHENAHLIMDHYSGFPTDQSTPFSEAFVEYIPRVRFDLQKYMPDSTEFLAKLPEDRVLTARDMWSGLSQHSSKPLSKNFAYASSFLLGVGIMNRIMKAYECNIDLALSKYMDAFSRAKCPEDVVTQLAELINMDESILWDSKELQLEGQKWVREQYNTRSSYALLEQQSKEPGMKGSSV